MKDIFALEQDYYRLRVLDGMKFFAYCWLIVGETAIFGVLITEVWATGGSAKTDFPYSAYITLVSITENALTSLMRWTKLWYFEFVLNYNLSMDCFMFFR
jgi:hypothetical protein